MQAIALNRIRPGKFQTRSRMDEASLDELAESIKAQGVLQPFFFQAEDGIRDTSVTGVQTCALPISRRGRRGLRARLPCLGARRLACPRGNDVPLGARRGACRASVARAVGNADRAPASGDRKSVV